jgi:hypothetical protein
MKKVSISVLILLAACLCTVALYAQGPQAASGQSGPPSEKRLQLLNRSQSPLPNHKLRRVHKPTDRFLTSEEGRALMQISGSPISKSLNERFGEPSQAALDQARAVWAEISAQRAQIGSEPTTATVPCNNNGGARFNLEPRKNAVFQSGPSADFILNGAGSGADLIVQTANDWRGAYPGGGWDNSMSGYYVHTSKTVDCSVQFEGGLPNFANTQGIGQSVVVADSSRGAFFAADDRFPAGIGLFRASAANLSNPKICPPGTHGQKQADSCWMQTSPVLLDSNSEDFYDEIGIAVDERPTGAGAGDVYVLDSDTGRLYITACTNSSLNCSPLLTITTNTESANNFPFVQVRPDGVITVSYLGDFDPYPSLPIMFVTCTPAGAPKQPVCQQPVMVTDVVTPSGLMPNVNISVLGAQLFPQFANRRESDGSFTTFMVYTDCANLYLEPQPAAENGGCLNTEVMMTISQNGGQTWSAPTSITPAVAQNFFPSITNDASTGMTSIAYYSTKKDVFFRDTRVFMSQIPPGSTTAGPAHPVSSLSPVDVDPGGVSYLGALDFRMGAIAHGTGTAGQSHLYLSFDSGAVSGTYNQKPLPELNNFIELITY